MAEHIFWTASGARLKQVSFPVASGPNWIFLPGGPGLGSESLSTLTDTLKLPGTLWHLDLPGDGSNTTSDNAASFAKWQQALVEAVEALPSVILAAHSTGGMYALSTPLLEKKLEGIVLMDSAPDASWQHTFARKMEEMPISEVENWGRIYQESPNNETLRELTLASAPYLFTSKGMDAGRELLRNLPYNYETVEWSAAHFDATYQGLWVPQKIPALIFAGAEDEICPLSGFGTTFHRENILLKEIPDAGHFPWIENPKAVAAVFNEYVLRFMLDKF